MALVNSNWFAIGKQLNEHNTTIKTNMNLWNVYKSFRKLYILHWWTCISLIFSQIKDTCSLNSIKNNVI
jgi:hypothetical protein